MTTPSSIRTAELRSIGLAAGLTAVGFTHAEPFDEARVTLVARKEAGLHGGMQFTYRNPERSTTPTRIVANAQTLIVGAWPYRSPEHTERRASGVDPGPVPAGTIAAYAWRDHYASLRDALERIAAPIRDAGHTARVVADDNALVDRAAAVRAGIGWAGKNSNVLVPGHGSWFVLGTVVTDAPIDPSEYDAPVEPSCGSCRRCIDGCPTGAIVADAVVDARRCLAWLVQAEGDFPLEFRAALGTRIYGCDDCQIVCPPSRAADVAVVGDEVTAIDLLELLAMSDEQILDTVGRWYIARRDPRYVRRNALVALGNVLRAAAAEPARASMPGHPPAPDPATVGRVRQVVRSFIGTDEMLSEHARWALGED